MADPRMAEHQHRLQQLEGLRNVPTNDEFNMYEKLAAGRLATVDPENGNPQIHYIPVPVTLKSQMGSPVSTCLTLWNLSCILDAWSNTSQDHSGCRRLCDHFDHPFLRPHGVPWLVSNGRVCR